MPRTRSIRSRLVRTARRQTPILGLDRLSARGICAEAGVRLRELYELYPGGLEELKVAVVDVELDSAAEAVPWITDSFHNDLVELARWCHQATHRHRGFVLACLSALYVSRPLGRVLRDKLTRGLLTLTRCMAAYWREGVWNERYDHLRIDELTDRLVISFIAGIVTREALAAFGLASDRFDAEEHVTEWLYGVARSPYQPADASVLSVGSWPPLQAPVSSETLVA